METGLLKFSSINIREQLAHIFDSYWLNTSKLLCNLVLIVLAKMARHKNLTIKNIFLLLMKIAY